MGRHATFQFHRRDILAEVDATITLLPRQAPLYMPISKILMRNDRLFVACYMRRPPPGEGHLIEKKYSGFRGPAIVNESGLFKEEVSWGGVPFILYFEQKILYDRFVELLNELNEPGPLRHIAVVPAQRKGFVHLVPSIGEVERFVAPVYNWFMRVFGGT